MNELGNKIRELRMKNKMSQDKLAKLCDASPSTLSLIESGDRNPSFEMLTRIAEALGVSVSFLTLDNNIELDKDITDKLAQLTESDKAELRAYLDYLLARGRQ